jgi:hypothetical protein
LVDLIALLGMEAIGDIVGRNRAALSRVEHWIDEKAYNSSVARYGIREDIRKLLDLPVGQFPTYTDAILTISRLLKKPASYLEIGVSVGKNFFQTADFLEESTLLGFDIEAINPVLKSLFAGERIIEEWPSAPWSAKAGPASLTEFSYPPRRNRILYLCADLCDENSWKRLSGRSFNIIFSDAVHSPEKIMHEFEMIERYGLRDGEEFILVWDDLAGPMTRAFDEIWFTLEREGAQRHIIPLNGWLGINEPPHMVGFITKL